MKFDNATVVSRDANDKYWRYIDIDTSKFKAGNTVIKGETKDDSAYPSLIAFKTSNIIVRYPDNTFAIGGYRNSDYNTALFVRQSGDDTEGFKWIDGGGLSKFFPRDEYDAGDKKRVREIANFYLS
jgi:uncharacterized protein (DUF1330 family)